MATKYTLQTLEGQALKTTSKKQSAIAAAEKDGLTSFRVVTDSGNVVYEQVPDTAAEPEAEDLIDGPTETVFYETLEFPGNYSIVTAPMALEIAAAAGVPAKSENLKGSLTRKVFFGGDDMDLTSRTVNLIQETVVEALAAMKVWQKENLEKRKGLTDMQRYVQHREFIAAHGTTVAKRVKKDGV